MFRSDKIDHITRHIFLDSSDEAIDTWVQAFHEMIASIPEDKPFYYLFDVSGENVYFTPYAREQSKTVYSNYRHRKGYVAFIMVWVTGPHIAKLFMSSLGKLDYQVEFFNTQEEGLHWLQDQ